MKRNYLLFICIVLVWLPYTASGQLYSGKFNEANYQESKVPEYTLPDVLTSFDGQKITSTSEWEQIRKPEIIKFFEQNIYGEIPTPMYPIEKSFEFLSEDKTILDGLCTRKEIQITLKNKLGKVQMPLVLFIPNAATNAVPVILLANRSDIKNNRVTLNDSQSYGQTGNGIPIHQLMSRGIGLATIDYHAFIEDKKYDQGKINGGITKLFFKPGQEYTKANEWGMIAIWAYALRAGLDYLETNNQVRADQVASLGCSIGGKIALWASATDPRFAMTLLATTGHGGDAIWRRQFGETLENMCIYLPTWICRNAAKYATRIDEMPVDQHSLLATLAPRPYYAATAQHDLWADSKGQWIGVYNSAPAYELYQQKIGYGSEIRPKVNHPIIESTIGFHVRSGTHGFYLYDWEKYMQFIEYHFFNIKPRTVDEVYNSKG